MPEDPKPFQAEVTRLLEIVTHSLYSEKSVFLRELIANASDACDCLRYLALTSPDLASEDRQYHILLRADPQSFTLSVKDNGIGMSREELEHNLGTIARSGTLEFLKSAKESDLSLIGQFGVGFYSAFMVARQVDVFSRKAGHAQSWHWSSKGQGTFEIRELEEERDVGTTIVLTLKEEEDTYLKIDTLRTMVQKYASNINFPIYLESLDSEPLNTSSALWTRPKNEISNEQYTEFYRHVSHSYDEPWITIHWSVEGILAYRALLYIPTLKPFDLLDPRRASKIKLYVKRVFISDQIEGLVPPYLRFLRGIVDSEDLPLNVSREILQKNTLIERIKAGIAKRVLSELKSKTSDPQYETFWSNFGAVLKEGLYEDAENTPQLLELARFFSTKSNTDTITLEEYVARMKQGQETVFFMIGESLEALRKSPQLEMFLAHDIEVLLLTDPIDEFWLPAVKKYQNKEFRSVTRGRTHLDAIVPPQSKEGETTLSPLLTAFKDILGENVKDVRESERLIESAVCLVADEGDMDMNLERLLRHHQKVSSSSRRVLEVNPAHTAIQTLAKRFERDGLQDVIKDAVWLLFDQARILEGEPLSDPQMFSRRLAFFVERGSAASSEGAPDPPGHG